MDFQTIQNQLGFDLSQWQGNALTVRSPINGQPLAVLKTDDAASVERKIAAACKAFEAWRGVPAPKRGVLVRLLGEELRAHKEPLAQLVTLECGKILEEGRGEVQEMIDICDFAVGLSRQLYGLTIASERFHHVMQENWHPLGVVGVISAFNFPVAVWAWNAALALVCGDPVLWKPSEKTPLTAIACQFLLHKAASRFMTETGVAVPEGLSDLLIGKAEVGEQLVKDARLPLISATGSTRMGRAVAPLVAARFGRCLLELGGNNAIILSAHADLNTALPSILFGSVGTAGQRCTTTRRLFVHRSLYREVADRLVKLYEGLNPKIGSPHDAATLIGPLIDRAAFDAMQQALQDAMNEGAEVFFGKRVREDLGADAYYVHPALVLCDRQSEAVQRETFAPILYLMPYDTLEEAIALNNAVPQGLSAAIFTTDIREAEAFKQGSDTGICNVNIGTSGAEIGGAFGGEKETGGGRESGSDAWKQYMRRQTSTTYYGFKKPELAQGIRFD